MYFAANVVEISAPLVGDACVSPKYPLRSRFPRVLRCDVARGGVLGE